MTRPLPETESQLAAALVAVSGQLGQLDARWPALASEHAAAGVHVPRAEAHVRLGADFAGHPLFRAYEALCSALDALLEHNPVPAWHAGESEAGAVAPGEGAAAAGNVSSEPVATTFVPAPQETGESPDGADAFEPLSAAGSRGSGQETAAAAGAGPTGDGDPPEASDLDEASVFIVGRGHATTRRCEATPRDVLGVPGPAARSLRERLGAALRDMGAVEATTLRSMRDRIGAALGNSLETPAVESVERSDRRMPGTPSAPRTSRLPTPPPRRGSGLWRDEASVVIVRGSGGQPERRTGGQAPPARAPGIPDADGDR